MSEILLPHNATELEKALDLLVDARLKPLGSGALGISGIKYDPPGAWLPWLVWEYGLMEVLPYIKDYRRAIREGIQWQRTRGTPKSLEIALSWIGATPVIEQEEPGCVHWAEFQLDSGYVPTAEDVNRLIAVTRLSAPARSRLARIFHGYDLRRVKLDVSLLGDALLSDYSGRMHSDRKTKLSFGRTLGGDALLGKTMLFAAAGNLCVGFAGYGDRCNLDWMLLDTCLPVPNPFIMHSHLFSQASGVGVHSPSGLQLRKFCKAEVVPGDSTVLGDINACTPGFVWREHGDGFSLSGSGLSQTVSGFFREEVTERFVRQHTQTALIPKLITSGCRAACRILQGAVIGWKLGALRFGEDRNLQDRWQRRSLHTVVSSPMIEQVEIVEELGSVLLLEYGHPVRLSEGDLDEPWRFERSVTECRTKYWARVPARIAKRSFCRAEIVPSDDGLGLGEADACTPGFVWHEEGGPITLGSDRISETVWRMVRAECTDRRDNEHLFGCLIPGPLVPVFCDQPCVSSAFTMLAERVLGSFFLDDRKPISPTSSRKASTVCGSASWDGQTWTGYSWPDVSWNDLREIVSSIHIAQ